MICPKCTAIMREREDRFPDCEDCGFELLDPWTIVIRDETRREFEQAKQECWPDRVPSYAEYMGRKA